jgi:hypothetical protein
LLRLIIAFGGATPVAATVVLLMIGTLAGLSLGLALMIALGVGLVLFLYSTAIVLHALGGATRFPVFAAGIELSIVLVIAAVFAPIAVVGTVARGVMLVRSARRLRWADI